MERPDRLQVELVEHKPGASYSGIGRYTRQLYHHLTCVSVSMVEQLYPPLARYIDPLHYFPVGVKKHRQGSIVHFTEDFGCSQMLWRPIRPAVATSHDLGFLAWPPEASMHRALDRILLYLSYLGLKRMDAVITVSEYSRQTLIQRLQIPAERVFTVYSGNDNKLFRPIADARAKLAQRYGFPEDLNGKFLLYVGTEFPRKNLATIFQILKRLPPNVRLLKVGPPGGKRFRMSTEKMIAELELKDRVFFFGRVPDEDLPLIYSAADAYICASFLEGFGHPVVESMACGTPVICSNSSSLPEITGDAAILVPPEEAEAFTEAVYRVLYDEVLRDQMVMRGRQQAASFSWEQTAKTVAEVYRLVVKN